MSDENRDAERVKRATGLVDDSASTNWLAQSDLDAAKPQILNIGLRNADSERQADLGIADANLHLPRPDSAAVSHDEMNDPSAVDCLSSNPAHVCDALTASTATAKQRSKKSCSDRHMHPRAMRRFVLGGR